MMTTQSRIGIFATTYSTAAVGVQQSDTKRKDYRVWKFAAEFFDHCARGSNGWPRESRRVTCPGANQRRAAPSNTRTHKRDNGSLSRCEPPPKSTSSHPSRRSEVPRAYTNCLAAVYLSAPAAVNPDDTLEEHAAEIRRSLQDIRRVLSNALDIAIAVGQRLNIAKDQLPDGKWSKWLRDDCELSRSTALLYMRLASHQGDIDAARVQLPNLSLRAARRLLTKSITPEAEKSDAAEPDEASGEDAPVDRAADLLAAWEAASIAERKDVLNSIKLPGIIEAMSSDMFDALMKRAETSRRKKANKKPTVIEGTAAHIN
jgi:hypothetical protein